MLPVVTIAETSSDTKTEEVQKISEKELRKAEKRAEKEAKKAEKELRKAEKRAEKEAKKIAKQTEKAMKMAQKIAEKVAKGEISSDKLSCVRSAVEERESSIQDAFTSFTSEVLDAMKIRSAALSAAYTNTENAERYKAREEAHRTFRETVKTYNENYKLDQKTAREEFRGEVKECGVSESDGEVEDNVVTSTPASAEI